MAMMSIIVGYIFNFFYSTQRLALFHLYVIFLYAQTQWIVLYVCTRLLLPEVLKNDDAPDSFYSHFLFIFLVFFLST